MQRRDRYNRISRSVDQQHRRLREFRVRKPCCSGEHPRIAHHRGNSSWSAQPDMERHHRALAKADQRQVRLSQFIFGQLAIDEGVDRWSCRCCACGQSRWRKSGQPPPLIASPHHPAPLRRMGCEEQCIRKRVLPLRCERNHVGSARTEAMKQQNDLLGPRSGSWLEAGAIDNFRQ